MLIILHAHQFLVKGKYTYEHYIQELYAIPYIRLQLGPGIFVAEDGYHFLYEEMLLYAKEALQKEGNISILVLDGDTASQNIAAKHGFYATEKKEHDAVYPIDQASNISYTLPDGFQITSMAETYDLYRYGQVLWKRFNHEANGQGAFHLPDEDLPQWDITFHRPNVNLDLKIAAITPNGDFVSYCGMWHDEASGNLWPPIPPIESWGLAGQSCWKPFGAVESLAQSGPLLGRPSSFTTKSASVRTQLLHGGNSAKSTVALS